MYLFINPAQTDLTGWVDTQLKKLNFPEIMIFLKARSIAFVLVGNESYLISKHRKEDEIVTQIFFTFITYHAFGFPCES